MYKLKTQVNDANVQEFLNSIEDKVKRGDSMKILDMMSEVSGKEAKMWGPSIIGFGKYHYKYQSGHEGDMPEIAFSPRKQQLTIYLNLPNGWNDYKEETDKLGKHSTSKACLYIKRLNDVDEDVLKEIFKKSWNLPI